MGLIKVSNALYFNCELKLAGPSRKFNFHKYKCNRRKCLWTFRILSVGNNFTKLQTIIKFGSDKMRCTSIANWQRHQRSSTTQIQTQYKRMTVKLFQYCNEKNLTSKGIFGARPLVLNLLLINTCFKKKLNFESHKIVSPLYSLSSPFNQTCLKEKSKG